MPKGEKRHLRRIRDEDEIPDDRKLTHNQQRKVSPKRDLGGNSDSDSDSGQPQQFKQLSVEDLKQTSLREQKQGKIDQLLMQASRPAAHSGGAKQSHFSFNDPSHKMTDISKKKQSFLQLSELDIKDIDEDLFQVEEGVNHDAYIQSYPRATEEFKEPQTQSPPRRVSPPSSRLNFLSKDQPHLDHRNSQTTTMPSMEVEADVRVEETKAPVLKQSIQEKPEIKDLKKVRQAVIVGDFDGLEKGLVEALIRSHLQWKILQFKENLKDYALIKGDRGKGSSPVEDMQSYRQAKRNMLLELNRSELQQQLELKALRPFKEIYEEEKRKAEGAPDVRESNQEKKQEKKDNMELVVTEQQFFQSKTKQTAESLQPKPQRPKELIVMPESKATAQPAASQKQLWAQRYAPASGDQIYDQENLHKIVHWLSCWNNQAPVAADTKTFQNYNTSAKAALLSGPPGIGKTTLIRLVAKLQRCQLIEWNASDVRSKSQIDSYVRHLQDNTVIAFENNQVKGNDKVIILMDEVDGMTGSDKGGIKCLIEMIKATKVPIICICNDRNNQKIRALANYCYDIQMKPPQEKWVIDLMEKICRSENISYQKDQLLQQAKACNCDIRVLMNALQLHKLGDKTAFGNSSQKDLAVTTNIFEACRKLLEHDASKKIAQLLDLYFIDPDMMQLMFYENYIDICANNRNNMQLLARATSSIAEADILQTKIRRQNEWALMPNAGFLSTVYPSQLLKGKFFKKVQFPAQLGKMSTETKQKRIVSEVKDALSANTYLAPTRAVKMSYIDSIHSLMISYLKQEGIQFLETAISFLKAHGLSLKQFEELIAQSVLQFPRRDQYNKEIPTQTRSLLKKMEKIEMDSAQQMESGYTVKQNRAAKLLTKYNELEEANQDEEEEEEDENVQKNKKRQQPAQQQQQQQKIKKPKGTKKVTKKK